MSGDNPVNDMLDQFVGLKIAGGCDYCDAYQTTERPEPGVYLSHIHHDDWCPWWLQFQNRAARRAAHKRTKRRRR